MVEYWNNACTKPEHWAIDTGKNNSDRSKLSGVNLRFVQASGRENGLFLWKNITRTDLVRDMDIRGQSFEKENETEIARLKSDYAGYTGYDGDVVGDQFRIVTRYPGNISNKRCSMFIFKSWLEKHHSVQYLATFDHHHRNQPLISG